MLRLGSGIAGMVLLCAAALPAAAGTVPQPVLLRPAAYMRVFSITEAPAGFVAMCARSPDLCQSSPGKAGRIALTPARFKELAEANAIANHTVRPVSDQELYGTSEYWALPADRGDCEDYAILKQQLLIERGWPMSALLLTVVRDESRQGHAILTVRTTAGDLLLDNRFDEVRRWYEVPYQFVKRQSYLDPRQWMTLVPADRDAPRQMATMPAN